MLARLFRRHTPQLPTSSAELAEALRTAAQFADSDSARLEYTNAADALDRAITHTRQHGDEPTRDALAYALGRAELNLKDQLSELIEVSKDTHLLVQGQGAAVESLRAEFHFGLSQVGERLTDVEGRTMQLEQKVAEHDESRDRSIENRRRLDQDMAESKQHRARLQATLDTELPAIHQAIADLNTRHGTQIGENAQQLSEAVQQLGIIASRLHAIEQLLELAGPHEAGG